MSARVMTDGDYRSEVKRVRKALKRLGETVDKEKATDAISQILTLASQKIEELKQSTKQNQT